MKRFVIYIYFLLCVIILPAQKNNGFNITFGFGPGYFFNDKSLSRLVNFTGFMGVNYVVNNKNQTLGFCPALYIQSNDYRAHITDERRVHVSQRLFSLNLDVLMKISKKNLLRVGLLLHRLNYSSVSISQNYSNSTGYYGYSNNELTKGYSPAYVQAGFTLGWSFLFKLFKRAQKFNVKFMQIASPIVSSGYSLSKKLISEDVNVLSSKARSSFLTFGFDFSLKRLKKKKIEEEE